MLVTHNWLRRTGLVTSKRSKNFQFPCKVAHGCWRLLAVARRDCLQRACFIQNLMIVVVAIRSPIVCIIACCCRIMKCIKNSQKMLKDQIKGRASGIWNVVIWIKMYILGSKVNTIYVHFAFKLKVVPNCCNTTYLKWWNFYSDGDHSPCLVYIAFFTISLQIVECKCRQVGVSHVNYTWLHNLLATKAIKKQTCD